MNREDIIRMAQEAGIMSDVLQLGDNLKLLERFAALVASAERERLTDAAMKAAEKAVDVAIALEREACANLCELMWHEWLDSPEENEPNKPDAEDCYRAIRARSNP